MSCSSFGYANNSHGYGSNVSWLRCRSRTTGGRTCFGSSWGLSTIGSVTSAVAPSHSYSPVAFRSASCGAFYAPTRHNPSGTCSATTYRKGCTKGNTSGRLTSSDTATGTRRAGAASPRAKDFYRRPYASYSSHRTVKATTTARTDRCNGNRSAYPAPIAVRNNGPSSGVGRATCPGSDRGLRTRHSSGHKRGRCTGNASSSKATCLSSAAKPANSSRAKSGATITRIGSR